MRDRRLGYLGAALALAGLVLAIGGLGGSIPVSRTLAWSGLGLLAAGLVLAYGCGGRYALRRWEEGEWVPATGTVVGKGVDPYGVVQHLELRLTAPGLGCFTARAFLPSEVAAADVEKGERVEALVRSNQRSLATITRLGTTATENLAGVADAA